MNLSPGCSKWWTELEAANIVTLTAMDTRSFTRKQLRAASRSLSE